MSNLLVIGGFTESERVLEPVADEAIEQGFGYDAEVLTLREAIKMDGERLRSLMAGMNIITHSAGVVAVPDARRRVAHSELPEELIIIAGPEPRPAGRLAALAIRKTNEHLFGKTVHPRGAHLRVVAGNIAEGAAHFPTNLSLSGLISRFSTINQLDTRQVAASGRTGNFMMSDDIFYADPQWSNRAALQDLMRGGCMVAELFGSHDELLVSPKDVLRDVREAFEATDERR